MLSMRFIAGKHVIGAVLLLLLVNFVGCGFSTKRQNTKPLNASTTEVLVSPVRQVLSAEEACRAAVQQHTAPLNDTAGAEFNVKPGDLAKEPVYWGDGWVKDGEPFEFTVNAAKMTLIRVVYPGDGYALAMLKVLPETPACVLAVWAYSFGGNGIEFVDMTRLADTNDGWARIRVQLDCWCHGYFYDTDSDDTDPYDTDSYIPPQAEPLAVILETDGNTVRCADDC
jgi:hypothetical protein